MIRAPVPYVDPTIRPGALRRSLAYVRTGSLPPLPVMPINLDAAVSLTFSSALCLATGYLLGSSIVP
ncbi:hypothetical protein [Roseomonas haemaphysalidis]|uniref:Uncharacterized protein n=1 Tax=Roseomonas haemaphysalidis TaxID=2768162 RepID=A0ABS3KWI1_9PROT|nr:hypothetical protein [Roseomonas haemaphysalidis]MBO1081840.1 hypothetical protein [Roseomonas haemaphysalidis]